MRKVSSKITHFLSRQMAHLCSALAYQFFSPYLFRAHVETIRTFLFSELSCNENFYRDSRPRVCVFRTCAFSKPCPNPKTPPSYSPPLFAIASYLFHFVFGRKTIANSSHFPPFSFSYDICFKTEFFFNDVIITGVYLNVYRLHRALTFRQKRRW